MNIIKGMLVSLGVLSTFGLLLNDSFAVKVTKEEPIAVFQVLDKITAKKNVLYVKVNTLIQFDTLKIKVKACYRSPKTSAPESEAYFIVFDHPKGKKSYKAFEGWMFASTPSVVAIKHPIYDIVIQACISQVPEDKQLKEAIFEPPVMLSPPVPLKSTQEETDTDLPKETAN